MNERLSAVASRTLFRSLKYLVRAWARKIYMTTDLFNTAHSMQCNVVLSTRNITARARVLTSSLKITDFVSMKSALVHATRSINSQYPPRTSPGLEGTLQASPKEGNAHNPPIRHTCHPRESHTSVTLSVSYRDAAPRFR